MVFVAKDIGENREIIAFFDKAHGDARDRLFQRQV